MYILVTGVAGFIGFHLAKRLLADGHSVIGLDNCNDYYDIKLKQDRLDILQGLPQANNFRFVRLDLADRAGMENLFKEEQFTHVVNLAAQAGVRYSLTNPYAYIEANLAGFGHILEGCRQNGVQHLLFASSSSVYGMNKKQPYSPHHNVDHPVSLYAATKKSNELMAHAYSHLYGIPATGLRFFTVYGPWGRPDMAMYLFSKAISEGKPLRLFNHGKMRRDFTYIDDIVEGVVRLLPIPATPNTAFDAENPDPASSPAPWRIYNIGNGQTVELDRVIALLEAELGKKAILDMLPMQDGDVEATWADTADLAQTTGYAPFTPIEEGIRKYVAWHKEYYKA